MVEVVALGFDLRLGEALMSQMRLSDNLECSQAIPLTGLRAGQGGLVCGITGDGEFLHRLREMGLCDGAEICMLRPGCPCIVRLGEQKLCFRSGELNSVLVEPCGTRAPESR